MSYTSPLEIESGDLQDSGVSRYSRHTAELLKHAPHRVHEAHALVWAFHSAVLPRLRGGLQEQKRPANSTQWQPHGPSVNCVYSIEAVHAARWHVLIETGAFVRGVSDTGNFHFFARMPDANRSSSVLAVPSTLYATTLLSIRQTPERSAFLQLEYPPPCSLFNSNDALLWAQWF